MEDLLKFSHFLEISRDTRKLILDMVRSIHSLVPSNPVMASRVSGLNYAGVMDHTAEILETMREEQEIFDGIIDPDELEKYVKAASDFREIGDQIEKLLNAVRDYQALANYLTFSLVKMIKDHLELIHPEDHKELNEKLAELYPPSKVAYKNNQTKLRVV